MWGWSAAGNEGEEKVCEGPVDPGAYEVPVPWNAAQYGYDVSTDGTAYPARVRPPVPSTSSTLRVAFVLKGQLPGGQVDSSHSYVVLKPADLSQKFVQRVVQPPSTAPSEQRRTDSSDTNDNFS